MPARIMIVHDEPDFADEVASILRPGEDNVARFADPAAALDALESAERIELLVSCVDFGPGKLNGEALVRMARARRPEINVLLIGPLELAEYAGALGHFLREPVSPWELMTTIERLLLESRPVVPPAREA
jgi:DNA-binding NtrC family response regulator